MKVGMRPWITNDERESFDDSRISFESMGVLESINEYSGHAAQPAPISVSQNSSAHTNPQSNTWECAVNTLSDFSFTAFVGIDWADRKHDICLQAANTQEREFECIAHRVDDIEQWALTTHRRFGGRIAVALELSKGPLVYALQKYDFFVLFPINPVSLAKYREALHPSGAKDDPTDAELALELVMRHPERFKPLEPQSAQMRELLHLVEHRRVLVADRVRYSNRLTATLKQYYPQALEWFKQRDTRLFCDFIRRWPTLLRAKHARRTTLETFFRDHHAYRRDLIEKRIQAIKPSSPLTEDVAVINAHQRKALVLVNQLRVCCDAIKEYDKAIATLADQHEDYAIFSALPGAGDTMAPRLLTAFGEQRDRFTSAAEVQKYSAIAPVTERSGNKCWVHWRLQGSTFLRQTFVEWAAKTINRSYWAGIYYHQQISKGKTHQMAVRSLAYKWIRILYRCWQDRVPYDEAKYLKILQKRGSLLVA